MDRGSSHEKRMGTHTVSDLATGLQSQGCRGNYREVSEPGNERALEQPPQGALGHGWTRRALAENK